MYTFYELLQFCLSNCLQMLPCHVILFANNLCYINSNGTHALGTYTYLDKTKFLSVKLGIILFSYPSVLTYVLGAQKNRLIETVHLSTHNIYFG